MKKVLFALLAIFMMTSCAQEKKVSLRWATFNVRYDNPGDSLNNWKFRANRVCQFITDKQLDVVGTQEVLFNQFNDMKERLPQYAAVGVGRDDGKTKGEYAAIFYRKDKFDALDSGTFWLSETPEKVGVMGWDAVCVRIATWAKLQDKRTGKIFMAVNTHFDHVGEVARRESALLIIRKIKEIVGDRPAVVTGDFNVDDQSEAYKTMVSNEFVLNDAHKVAKQKEGVDYTFHNFAKIKPAECQKIDFIFTTPQIEVMSSTIPQEQPEALLSDHNPQWTELNF